MGVRELSPELAKKAKDELNEDPQRIIEDLQKIKEWIAKQPHLNVRMDDQWLVTFLRGCKYSLERTKEKLDMFYTMRTAVPELCSVDLTDPKVLEVFKLGILVLLPKTEKKDDPRVLLMRPGVYDGNKLKLLDTLRASHILNSILMMDDDQSAVAGLLFISDMNNMTIAHFSQMTPSIMKKAVASGQDAFPVRQKGNHILNSPPAAEALFNLARHLMNEKNKNRMFMHTNMEALYKFIPKSTLPTEYGGDAGPIQDMIDYTVKTVESKRDWLSEEINYKSDESKRPGKPKTVETLFGIEGSFRQLNVD